MLYVTVLITVFGKKFLPKAFFGFQRIMVRVIQRIHILTFLLQEFFNDLKVNLLFYGKLLNMVRIYAIHVLHLLVLHEPYTVLINDCRLLYQNLT